MKKLVWLLLLINLGLLAFFNQGLLLPSAQKVTLIAIQPEKISILNQLEIDALPKKQATTSAASVVNNATYNIDTTIASDNNSAPLTLERVALNTSCYEWGVFSNANLTGAQMAISKLSIPATIKEQSSQEAKRFWVFKAPLKTVEAAQAKAQELRALGIQDLYIVQDARFKNAISFGVFEDERLATNLLNELKAKGIDEVIKATRNQGQGHASLQFTKLTENDVLELQKLKSYYPEAELKKVSCS